ncbi:MAG: hypothetical protein F9B45_32535 [Phycisphaera sp. RhM]|nr:hypothetical protein [Phycisphaera sp. RhM]
MYRFVACSLVCLIAISSSAAEPPHQHQEELTEIKRQLSDLTRRIAKLENSIKRRHSGDDISIRYDQLRLPYGSADERDLVRTEISTKGRNAYFAGQFSTDAGWRQISVDNSHDIDTGVIRIAAISLRTGLMSEILDDGEALYILRVNKRSK